MYTSALRCTRCQETYSIEPIYVCAKCGGSLDVEYDYKSLFERISFSQMASRKHRGIWKYRELLPVGVETNPVTLGEGQTPLSTLHHMNDDFNQPNIFLKNETVNPTLSFKDRPLSVALTVAKQFGMSAVMCASTGNTGVAASAYAARAGLTCTIYVPESTPREKLQAMERYGARLIKVAGHFSDAYEIAGKQAEEQGAFNLTSTFLNPFAIEGNKTVAYELFDQLGRVPDWIVIPIGAGPLLVGCYKGFMEMKLAGCVDKLPRMVGVQASGCAPIVRAFHSGETEVSSWEAPQTIASGIADPLTSYPKDGSRTLATIRQSGGTAVGVGDEEIIRFGKLLALKEGILAESASVTAIAALKPLIEDGVILPHHTVVSVVTGHGIKDMTATNI
jgi:threonine synthase